MNDPSYYIIFFFTKTEDGACLSDRDMIDNIHIQSNGADTFDRSVNNAYDYTDFLWERHFGKTPVGSRYLVPFCGKDKNIQGHIN